MTNVTLAQSYLIKAQKRMKILSILLEEQAYSDVVREAQEIVELALKGPFSPPRSSSPPSIHSREARRGKSAIQRRSTGALARQDGSRPGAAAPPERAG